MTVQADPAAHRRAPKGFPASAPADLTRIGTLGWNVFTSGFQLPLAVLFERAILHNSAVMSAYCARNDVSLAPHGKTTMSPELFRIQLQDGAWAITAATVWQARTMWAAGVPRVLIANEVVTPPELRWLADVLSMTPDFDVLCYVDSVAGVELMDEVLGTAPLLRPLPVLVELGFVGGRTGTRTINEGLAVARAVDESRHLVLRGTSGFEGIIKELENRSARDLVCEFLKDLHRLTVAIDKRGGFERTDEVIVSAGGSAFFDYVVNELVQIELGRPVRPVLRSGCYLTHADGGYDLVSPMGRSPRVDPEERFLAAMEVWGTVLSRPEPTQAIVGIGKRDISYDSGPPLVRGFRTSDGKVVRTTGTVVDLNDQHANLYIAASSPLAVGDLVALGVAHPCTTFDKWRVIPMINDRYDIVSVVRTHF